MSVRVLGIFLAFQYPVAIPGVTVANFLRTAINSRRRAENPEDKGMPIPEFRKMLKEKMVHAEDGSDLCWSLPQ
jgi:Fe-S cluster assembly ATP-binding protein